MARTIDSATLWKGFVVLPKACVLHIVWVFLFNKKQSVVIGLWKAAAHADIAIACMGYSPLLENEGRGRYFIQRIKAIAPI